MRSCFRILGILLLAFVVFATICPISERPVSGLPVPIERALAFGLVTICLAIGWPRHRLAIMAALAVAAIGLEFSQFLQASRHFGYPDIAEKVTGVLAGGAVAAIVRI